MSVIRCKIGESSLNFILMLLLSTRLFTIQLPRDLLMNPGAMTLSAYLTLTDSLYTYLLPPNAYTLMPISVC